MGTLGESQGGLPTSAKGRSNLGGMVCVSGIFLLHGREAFLPTMCLSLTSPLGGGGGGRQPPAFPSLLSLSLFAHLKYFCMRKISQPPCQSCPWKVPLHTCCILCVPPSLLLLLSHTPHTPVLFPLLPLCHTTTAHI